jgi:serine/threonine protein kinase
VGRIGAGGMGVVFLAESSDGRRVAVKMIRSELTQDAVVRQRFLREVNAARQVRSPVTAQVLDADAESSPPWVAFEYIDSPNLEEVVEDQLPRLSAAIGILSGIAEALLAIHHEGIIHRDLKPSNILCPPNGVKVIDFGIAAAKESTALTASGLIGTPAWLSPEQILGQPLTAAVDVFAWGCVAVYTLTGRLPFSGAEDSPAALYYRIVNASVDLTGIPPQLLRPVAAALAKDPRERPPVPALL